MGQKTHPLGFRLGITQDHLSTWFANSSKLIKLNKSIISNNKIDSYRIFFYRKSNSIINVFNMGLNIFFIMHNNDISYAS